MSAALTRSRRCVVVELRRLDGQAFLDDLEDRHARRQRAERVLEDDLHVLAQRAHLAVGQPVDALADVGDRPLRGDEPQDGEAERRLARAGFADDAERLALAQLERQPVDGLHVVDRAAHGAPLDREPHLEVVGLDDDGRRVVGGRRLALRLGREQLLGIGVLRRGEDVLGGAFLDDLAALHDVDALGHLAHDAEVVGDEQHRHAHLALQLLQQLEDLRLDGDVERRRRLVGDQQVRLVGERHGDHHALALAARKLMREGAEALLRLADADLVQQLEHARAHGLLVHAPVHAQHLAHLLLDGVQRVERRHRLLEDDRDAVAAHGLQLRRLELQQIAGPRTRSRRTGARRRDRAAAAGSTAPRPSCRSPNSPTSATVSPLPMRNETVDRRRSAVAAGGTRPTGS